MYCDHVHTWSNIIYLQLITFTKFKVRIEKNAIVCANAGHSNWTDVCDYAARAQQSLRKIKKSQGDNDACVDDSMDGNIEELLELEEVKVVSQQLTPSLNTH